MIGEAGGWLIRCKMGILQREMDGDDLMGDMMKMKSYA